MFDIPYTYASGLWNNTDNPCKNAPPVYADGEYCKIGNTIIAYDGWNNHLYFNGFWGSRRPWIRLVNNEIDNLFVEFEVPIAGKEISNYYASVNTNIDTSTYYPISIKDGYGNWNEFCTYHLYGNGQVIDIRCIKSSYTIPSATKPLIVVCQKLK